MKQGKFQPKSSLKRAKSSSFQFSIVPSFQTGQPCSGAFPRVVSFSSELKPLS